MRFVGYWRRVVVRIDCIQLNTATADSWSCRDLDQGRGNALGAIRGLERAGFVVFGERIFAPDKVPGFFIGFS